jgi:hypothetical protein
VKLCRGRRIAEVQRFRGQRFKGSQVHRFIGSDDQRRFRGSEVL